MANTVALLKQQILSMAVSGKLEEQREAEESAKQLLYEIQKQNLTKIEPHKGEESAEPFKIPENWEWVRLEEVASIIMGQSPPGISVSQEIDGIEFHQGKTNFGNVFLQKSDNQTNNPKKIVEENTLLLSVRAPVGNLNISTRKIAIGRGLCGIVGHSGISSKFLFYFLSTAKETMENKATGTTFKAISGAVIRELKIPLPPLAEQERIVSKIESLFTIIDKISEKKEDSLKLIDNIRKTALQDAVMGKLVEQDETDETAVELLKVIQEEKGQFLKDGKIKKSNTLNSTQNNPIPFELPKNWLWVSLSEISLYIKAGGDKPKEFSSIKTDFYNVPVIANGITNEGVVGYTNKPTISDSCLTISGRGTIGFSLVRTEPFTPIVRLLVVKVSNNISQKYIQYALTHFLEKGVGTSIKQLTVPMLRPKLVPLPPLAEQKRIVEKLDKIMAICDQMEEILDGSREETPVVK